VWECVPLTSLPPPPPPQWNCPRPKPPPLGLSDDILPPKPLPPGLSLVPPGPWFSVWLLPPPIPCLSADALCIVVDVGEDITVSPPITSTAETINTIANVELTLLIFFTKPKRYS
jgi:hypothetical protein